MHMQKCVRMNHQEISVLIRCKNVRGGGDLGSLAVGDGDPTFEGAATVQMNEHHSLMG